MMKAGDTFECAIWLDGRETLAIREQYRKDMNIVLGAECARHGLSHGELRFVEKRPGDERVPPVPAHIEGPNIRLLVCEADIKQGIKANSFLGDLEKKDLERLRQITRLAFAKKFNGGHLSDEGCDELIEHLGPDVAMAEVRKAVDRRVIH